MKTILLVIIPFMLWFASVHAAPPDADSVSRVDTVSFKPVLDSFPALQVTNPTNFEEHLYQKPTVALFKSLLVPGWGQFGNRRYVKAVVIAGLETWFVASVIHYGRQAADYKRKHEDATDLGVRNDYYSLYEDRRDQRNKFIWYAGITIFVSMFDAYVDAHLSGSPSCRRNDQITWQVKPDGNGGASVGLAYSF